VADTPDGIVREFRVSLRTRTRLALRAWLARWTGAERGRLWRRNYHGQFENYFAENAYEFGEYVSHKAIVGALRNALQALATRGDGPPCVVLRGVFPRRWSPFGFSADFSPATVERRPFGSKALPPRHAKGFINKGRFDIVAAAIIDAAGSELRKKSAPDHAVRQDYITDCDSEAHAFHEGHDLWLRFRQATPEFAPDDPRPDKVAANLVVIGCVENVIKDPLYVLPVADILSTLDHDTLFELRKKQFDFVDGWAADLSELSPHRKSIVSGGGDDPKSWYLSFDPNRVVIRSDKTPQEGLRAVAKLLDAINRIGQRTAPVLLRRGDALIVNNYRTLTRRKERSRFVFTWPWPPVRWLRVYYGFPRELTRREI